MKLRQEILNYYSAKHKRKYNILENCGKFGTYRHILWQFAMNSEPSDVSSRLRQSVYILYSRLIPCTMYI